MRAVLSRRVVREGLTEKTSEQRPGGQEGTSQEQTWEKRVLSRGNNSKCKGLELGTHFMCLTNSNIIF